MAVQNYQANGFGQALRYKGREGMWTWLLHRVTGLGILFFLLIHVFDTALVIYWPDIYDKSLDIYRHPVFRLGELAIFFSVLYHALNGLRIIIQDFWPYAMRHQAKMAWAAMGLSFALILPIAWIMMAPLFGLAEEPGLERHRERMRAREAAQVERSTITTTTTTEARP
ncbi:MAG TPA: succinate dehydrogenase, cytochrome b556 subunit [Longimicrobium sp.]|nr:succinate dehydrogenase, cytochrome b556 subunit [Longimicrobium sp.]